MLPSLISLRRARPPSAEDLFSSALDSIFTDDLQNLHGDDPDTIIVYNSLRRGALEFRTADVNGEEQRRKFAHYLWNASILLAELVSGRGEEKHGHREGESEDKWGTAGGRWWIGAEEEKQWAVDSETVLELGAGVGLAGIASVLSGAREVAVTDYPAPVILDAIKTNVSKNIPESIRSRVIVEGHQWGCLGTEFAQAKANCYTRILAADCLWMEHEHENLVRSMLHFLSYAPEARTYCIAGFHTGRAKIASFFEEAVPGLGLEVEEMFEMDADGNRRDWARERNGGREDIGERNKWLVVSRLKRASP